MNNSAQPKKKHKFFSLRCRLDTLNIFLKNYGIGYQTLVNVSGLKFVLGNEGCLPLLTEASVSGHQQC